MLPMTAHCVETARFDKNGPVCDFWIADTNLQYAINTGGSTDTRTEPLDKPRERRSLCQTLLLQIKIFCLPGWRFCAW